MNLQERLERERQHGKVIIATEENNWGWKTPAGQIRWKRRFNYLAQALPNADGQVLEVGAGSGTFTVGLADVYSNLMAIDISEDLINIARTRAPSAQFAAMDAHNLEVPDNSFDAIIGCSVLHHLDWNLALQGFYHKLKPGGVVRFSEPNLLNPQIFIQKTIPPIKKRLGDSPDEYAFTAWQIRRSLKRAGFSRITVTPYEFLHPSVPEKWIDAVIKLETLISKTFLKQIGGSLLIEAFKL
ncbi:methyltransferase domain-containing protein [Oscillatoria sp. FACHB-1407]|uniref:class I SAM-dependent methyltransferase n=1 Tax=Oscillatoria sp. FACHB-1407 TaxID=2692847 RepID=UPI0016890B5D|nr:class I SAM-dependent methyltransferase [Oscillatoria sp. FACHB-1407]MBD2464720.1 methyltransferase domain-containing protein [Oscillatoria sp. FACHB-1407]